MRIDSGLESEGREQRMSKELIASYPAHTAAEEHSARHGKRCQATHLATISLDAAGMKLVTTVH